MQHGIITINHFFCPRQSRIRPLTVPPGTHYVEIVTSGVVYHEDNGIRRKYGAGTMFWHVGGEETIHETEPDDPYRCFAFHFTGFDPARIVPRVIPGMPVEKVLEFGQECLKVFHSEMNNSEYFVNYVYYTLLYRAMMPSPPSVSYPKPLTKALKFIEKNADAVFPVDDIARRAEISKPHLFALFKQYLDCSPYQYMLKMRIDRAKQLLTNSNAPIKEIAALCGFTTLEVFYRQFHKSTGLSPAEYRKRFS